MEGDALQDCSHTSLAQPAWPVEPSQGVEAPIETETVAQLVSAWKVGPHVWAHPGDWILYLGPSSTNLSESGTDILRRGSSAGPTARKMHSFRWLTAWRTSKNREQHELWATYVSAWIEARLTDDLPKQAFKTRAICYRTQAFVAGLAELKLEPDLRQDLVAVLDDHKALIEELETARPRHEDLTFRSLELANWVLSSEAEGNR